MTVSEWSAENPVVAGRPGQRRSRQAVSGASATHGTLHVGAVVAGPVRLQHHALLHRLQRRALLRLAAQLTRGEPPPSRARARVPPRTLDRSRRRPRSRASRHQTAGETRSLLFDQACCQQKVRRSPFPDAEDQGAALEVGFDQTRGAHEAGIRDGRGRRRYLLRTLPTEKTR